MTPEKPSDSSDWDGKVQQWGTLREVMDGEAMDGQIRLSDVLDKPHVYGIGEDDRVVGHVDAAALKSGTIIRVPLRRAVP